MSKDKKGVAIRKHFDECMIKNIRTKINTYDEYIEYRDKIIYEEMKKCKNRKNIKDVADAILKAQNRVLSELNKRLGLSPYNQDFDELLLESITEIFCKKLGYEYNDIISIVYYRGGGTSPMEIKEKKLVPVSTPCSRLHNWICRQKFDIKEITRIIDGTKDNSNFSGITLREVLKGQYTITLGVLLQMIAIPLNLNSETIKMLVLEVLEDTVDLDSLMPIIASLLNNNPDQEKMPDPSLELTKSADHPKEVDRPTVCIIGASGFIGSNLMRRIGSSYRLILQFHKLPTKEMINDIPNDTLIYIGDLKNEDLTKRIFLENNIDFAFWLAASSTQQDCNNYLTAYDMNVDYLKCLFDLLGNKVITLKGLLLPSTCTLYMYDTSDKMIYCETDSLVCDGLNNYTLTKQRLENLAVDIAKNHEVNIIIARLSQIYGPGDTSKRLIPQSVASISQEEPLECVINEAGVSPCVNLIYIDDVINILIRICEFALKGKYDFNECRIINLAGERAYTVLEVLSILREVFESDVEIQKKETKDLNVKVYAVDTILAKNKFKFYPQTSLREGLTAIRDHLS